MTMLSASPQQLLFRCEHCGITFQRREHLNRHVRCHLQLRPFTCQNCGKSFSRQDTLKRHTVVHGQQHNALSKRGLKACSECTRSKQRCSGTVPCDRCNHRGLACHIAKPSIESSKGNTGGPPNEYPERSQIEDGAVSGHLYSPHQDTRTPIVGGNDPLNQYGFPGISEDFAFPFASPFDILPTNTSNFMLHCNRTALSLEDHMGFYLDDPIASTSGQMKHGGTMSTPERLLDEPIRQRTYSTPMGFQNDYCHVPEVSKHDYDALSRLYYKLVPASSSESNGNFPRREIMNVFVQLYFEYFHPGFHLLHQATFQRQQQSSCLLLAIATIGAQYSRVSSRGQCSLALLEILRRGLLNNVGSLTRSSFLSSSIACKSETLDRSIWAALLNMIFNWFRQQSYVHSLCHSTEGIIRWLKHSICVVFSWRCVVHL
ncbi:unnamed protein product [Penicillium nalgiovense]|nr:unnamed protein product [Penicillium nalgiovense]CAG8060581.1 unnamed protein product [Penicillium nalgiovense]CAG8061478.1 unnamed protein product [Penicillium nalgiovense]CAG8061743.1 unnamed protein product [Penicillium nalgiovense]